jgi:AAA domain (Cdc48 subfamily)
VSHSSGHLKEVERTALSGAHMIARGHLHDVVVLEGRVVTERWGLTQALHNAGLSTVVFVNASDGLHCPDPVARGKVEDLLHATHVGIDSVGETVHLRLGVRGAVEIAMAIRALLSQSALGVAVILEDLDLLVNPTDEQGRHAIALLRRAVEEAQCTGDGGSLAPRNLLVVLDCPSSPVAEGLARLPGVRLVDVAAPDRDTRLAVLRSQRRGFFDGEGDTADADAGLQVIADRMVNGSLRVLEQLRRISNAERVSPSRPAALLAAHRDHQHRNPIERVGIARIMQALETSVVGQPAALARLLELLERACEPSAIGPHGSFDTRPLMTVFAFGPPGVGKTETARTLARTLFGSERAYVRVDCSEFKNTHDVARLTGAPPGYVGYEDGGRLTEPLRRGPAVVLLDEFEKADVNTIARLLLAILDEGRLTDGRGETVSFERAILVITTNLGSSLLRKEVPADGAPDSPTYLARAEELVRELIGTRNYAEAMDQPELLSRLEGSFVGFDLLRRDALASLVHKYCSNIAANLGDELGVRVRIDVARFAETFGALLHEDGLWDGRHVERISRSRIELPLREQLANFPGRTANVVPGADGKAVILGEVDRRVAK